MLTFLEQSVGNVIAIQASGKLTHEDYELLLPTVKEVIQKHGKVRFWIELIDFHGWEPRASWDDLKFDVQHGSNYERCAIVGESKWQEWMTKLSKPFFTIKFFNEDQREQAWQWLLEGNGKN